jgi:hypothetical protein
MDGDGGSGGSVTRSLGRHTSSEVDVSLHSHSHATPPRHPVQQHQNSGGAGVGVGVGIASSGSAGRQTSAFGVASGSAAAPASTSSSGAPTSTQSPPDVHPRTLQQALSDFADYLPPSAAAAGITVDAIRAVRPSITIGTLNDEVLITITFIVIINCLRFTINMKWCCR